MHVMVFSASIDSSGGHKCVTELALSQDSFPGSLLSSHLNAIRSFSIWSRAVDAESTKLISNEIRA